MILVLSANAGIDRTYEVANFTVGHYHHPRRFRVIPGGKGVNVARVLRKLGNEVMVTGFAGGNVGNHLTAMLRAEGIRPEFVKIAEESRLCLNIVDETTRSQTQVDEVGPLVSPAELDLLQRQWGKLLRHCKLAVIAGSAPRGVPFEVYTDFIFAAKEARLPVVLDVREPYLAEAVQAGPTIVKPNLEELSSLVHSELSVPTGVTVAARDLLRHGIKLVLASLGKQGAIAVTAEAGNWWAKSPAVEQVSPVGSGDAMVAGLIHAGLRKEGLQGRLRWAVAAGAANTAKLGAACCEAEEIEKLVPEVKVEQLTEEGLVQAQPEAPPPAAPQAPQG
ncbi:MAG: 1-phosphofructokinase family hexose kinase [Armatimonadia bacterium]